MPPPASFSPNIVRFKGFNSDTVEGRRLWDQVSQRMNWFAGSATPDEAVRFGKPQIIPPRLGQGAFRLVVTDAYRRRCAVTGERTLPVLDAAHIHPYSEGGPYRVSNGLLLRRDLHKLFDDGYVTVSLDLRFEVSRRIRDDYENGREDGLENEYFCRSDTPTAASDGCLHTSYTGHGRHQTGGGQVGRSHALPG